MVVPAQLTAEAVNQLREPIDLLLGRWSALQMAIQNESGGRDQLAVDIIIGSFDLLRCYMSKTWRIYLILWLSLNTEIDDGSIEEIADNILIMHEECLESNFESIEQLRQSIPTVSHRMLVLNEDDLESVSSSGDESMEMVEELDPSSNMADLTLSELPPAPAPTPTVDADGWTTVTSRKNKGGGP